METITLNARAKINLTLDVVGKRPDGYHLLKMIMQSVSLADTLVLRRAEGISMRCSAAFLPVNGTNLAIRAAELFFAETATEGGVEINLEKRIPVAAGLAGGSADAAGTLVGLNRLYETGLTTQELQRMGLKLGADVPFAIQGGTALAEGVGERLTPLSPLADCTILLVKPRFSVSTAKVFGLLNWQKIKYRPDTENMLRQLQEGSLLPMARYMYNVLEDVTAQQRPEIREIGGRLLAMGAAGAMMSGSGPTVFGIFTEQHAAEAAKAAMERDYNEVFLCRPENCGVQVV